MTGIRRRGAASERGSALVEFVGLATLMIIPVFYLVMVAGRVEGAGFAVQGAAEAAGRAYATAGSDGLGQQRAQLAADLVLADAGVATTAVVRVDCGTCDYAPGSTVAVYVSVRVPLPGLPAGFCSAHSCLAAVQVHATHVERLPCYTAGVPAAGSC
ncbi:MAG: hypothetical protein ACYCO3_09235 [Mycobacteriales bacterium]